MSDAAFKTAAFPGYTTQELRETYNREPADIWVKMRAEIKRRERVAEGDVSVMTPAERLRHFKVTP
jgi:hypothetical protein